MRHHFHPAVIVASGAWGGFAPAASGTVGSFMLLVLWWLMARAGLLPDAAAQIIFAAVISIGGWYATHLVLTRKLVPQDGQRKKDDPSFVVIDEWAGMAISVIALGPGDIGLATAAFFLFRLFDVLKPGPVKWGEQRPGALGVMLDDIIAGLCTFAIIQGIASW